MGVSLSRRRGHAATSSSSSSSSSSSCLQCAAPSSHVTIRHRHRVCSRCVSSPYFHKHSSTELNVSAVESEGVSDIDDENIHIDIMYLSFFKETLPNQNANKTSNFFLSRYIQPYFQSHRRQLLRSSDVIKIENIDWKIMAMRPSMGVYNNNTRIEINTSPLSIHDELETLRIVVAKNTLNEHHERSDISSVMKLYLLENKSYLSEGDGFVIDDVQYVVVSTSPSSGHFIHSTSLTIDSVPASDLARIHMLPIYETLPINQRDISVDDLFRIYFEPFFSGRFRLMLCGQQFRINDVMFKVLACEPRTGLVTAATVIFGHGECLYADDVRQQQIRDDEMLAIRLQMQGSDDSDTDFNNSNGEDILHSLQRFWAARNSQIVLPLVQASQDWPRLGVPTSEDITSRIQPILDRLDAHMLSLYGGNEGVQQASIDHLPTRFFDANNQCSSMDPELKICRVCLNEYEDGDNIRSLPCFHSYHSTCIDTWLREHTQCPICKHSVV